MAAAQAGKRNRKVLLLEHSNKIGEKIRISGGGKCNFTNLYTTPKNYLSDNPHFAISALSQYTQHDFIKLVEKYNITYHEKTLGQLFCDGSSGQIINMLLEECKKFDVTILLNSTIMDVNKSEDFIIKTLNDGDFSATSLIVATGGLSIPKIGATDFGYRIAKQFGLNIVPTYPALVPLTVSEYDLDFFKSLSGISIPSIVNYDSAAFKENILFTHRGLSGPAILQISSYIKQPQNQIININLLPNLNLKELFIKEKNNKTLLANILKEFLPNRFVETWCTANITPKKLIDYKAKELEKIAETLHCFKININGTEGYLKAEVTAGGVSTGELSSKTMESKKVPNLYFIGEVVDVTGWLGGYNFQWAWSSGFVAGFSA
ncbi:NAD(P)/FAD-dependent oxidoreductase [Rickettsiales endosymbiont of Stachyamoeba lipophora]|nr:NAD(P)/FAD-dependent oxidoreductase [Rickettsiales endosymbiont of Stachyamoeba lipophora]